MQELYEILLEKYDKNFIGFSANEDTLTIAIMKNNFKKEIILKNIKDKSNDEIILIIEEMI